MQNQIVCSIYFDWIWVVFKSLILLLSILCLRSLLKRLSIQYVYRNVFLVFFRLNWHGVYVSRSGCKASFNLASVFEVFENFRFPFFLIAL
jgi:hypothetical protein